MPSLGTMHVRYTVWVSPRVLILNLITAQSPAGRDQTALAEPTPMTTDPLGWVDLIYEDGSGGFTYVKDDNFHDERWDMKALVEFVGGQAKFDQVYRKVPDPRGPDGHVWVEGQEGVLAVKPTRRGESRRSRTAHHALYVHVTHPPTHDPHPPTPTPPHTHPRSFVLHFDICSPLIDRPLQRSGTTKIPS